MLNKFSPFFLILVSFTLTPAAIDKPDIKVLEDNNASIILEFEVDEYTLETVDIEGRACSKVVLPGEVTFLEKGMPELPTIARNVIIPDNGQMAHRIIDIEYETRSVSTVVPSKGNLLRSVDPNSVPYTFDKFYEADAWWPEHSIELYEPFILRDYRGVTVRFNPFQYNPVLGELKICRRIVVEVYKTANGGVNVLDVEKKLATREFANIYKSIFLNFGQARYDSVSERAGRMVIISADVYLGNLAPFVEWKRRKGIETMVIPISTVGNNETSIKDTIQDEFNAGGLVWVLLVGDGNEVVPATGTVGSAYNYDADPVYAYTAGTDYYPDIFVSRFSSRGGNPVNIDKQVVRSIEYERSPMTGADWYHVGLGVASALSTPADSTRCNWLRDSLLQYTYTEVNKSYNPYGSPTLIKQYIEQGASIINYIGHGSTSGWSNGGGFSISNINTLSNPWLLPFVISVACYVGNFNGLDCYCEASVTAGEVNQPDGFLVHWGSVISQAWVPPCYGQEGAVNLLTHDEKNTAGGIFFNGACYMIQHYGGGVDGVQEAQAWTIFGDASIQLRTDTPEPMTVNHAAVLNVGQSTFDVNALGVSDALVGLYIDTLLVGHGYTDGSGNVTIDLDPIPVTPGTMHITVTGYNKIPYLDSVPVIVPTGPYLMAGSYIIDDGNNNQANPGDTVDLGLWAKNIGVETAYSVYGLLSEDDIYVTMDTDSSWYGNIASGDSAMSSPYYSFAIGNDCPDAHNINFTAEFTDADDSTWTSNVVVTVYAPVLVYQEHEVLGGNGNGILDPGETVDLVVTLENEGGADVLNVTSTLFTSSSFVTINDGVGNFGTIAAGATASNAGDPYSVTADVTTPHGTTVDFSIALQAGDYVDTLDFSLMVGQLVPSDTGYYYVYYSGGPHTYSPVFDWVAIDSTQTVHPGVSLDLGDDEYVLVSLPFSFPYYGINYTQVTISSNGWVAMGSQTSSYLTNYGIPSTSGPSAMIAGIWDDLDPGNTGAPSDIYYYHDAVNHRFIIEYFQVEHWSSGFHETFEIILYDPAYYPTPTGDGEVVVQYLVGLQQTDVTLGIENSAETVGIQYYYEGTYHELAVAVTDSFALRYTTYPPDYVGIEEYEELTQLPVRTLLAQVYPNPFARELRVSYQLASSSRVSLAVYDAAGRAVCGLVDGVSEPGYYLVSWDGCDDRGRRVPAGVYFVRFHTDDYQSVQKTVLLK
jgi:hypothetical protein